MLFISIDTALRVPMLPCRQEQELMIYTPETDHGKRSKPVHAINVGLSPSHLQDSMRLSQHGRGF